MQVIDEASNVMDDLALLELVPERPDYPEPMRDAIVAALKERFPQLGFVKSGYDWIVIARNMQPLDQMYVPEVELTNQEMVVVLGRCIKSVLEALDAPTYVAG